MERNPSCAASPRSRAVTSFWKSTKALPRADAGVRGTGRGASRDADSPAPEYLCATPESPQDFAAATPAAAPSARAAARPYTPRHAPAERSRSADEEGTNARAESLQVSRPRDCEKRCTDGA